MSVSKLIEQFILDTFGAEQELSLSRNSMADYFNCAPSQINYVINTRFNFENGFIVESRKGGNGYIKIIRIENKDNYINNLYNYLCTNEVSYSQALGVLQTLKEKQFITEKEFKIISFAISPKALSTPMKIENRLRSNILANVVSALVKGAEWWFAVNVELIKQQ